MSFLFLYIEINNIITMKLMKFNELHLQGGNYKNGDKHSYTQVNDNESNETIEFTNWLLKNSYILNHTKWEYRGTYYSTEELFDKYKNNHDSIIK